MLRAVPAVLVPASVAVALALSGCAAGPGYKPPPAPATQGYTAQALPSQTADTGVAGGAAQHLELGRDLPGQWWTLFGSAALDALIAQAMANYPDITAQQAALRAARENVLAGEGVFFPQLQGAINPQREKVSGASIGPGYPGFITNIFQASVNVSYTFDVFGGQRRQVESLRAQLLNQNFQLEASYLTLTANVASTAVQIASAREQIAVTRQIIDLEEKQLGLIERQYDLGTQTRADVLQQQSNLAAVRATLPALQQQLDTAQHQLAVLTGQFPHDMAPAEFTLADLKLPEDLPVSLPSALVAQRPDIQAQQATLWQASALIGVATANMLPQLTLTGSAGDESLLFASWFKPGSGIWNVSAGLTTPIFAGGTLRAKRRAAIDSYDEALAQYRLTVLNAFQNVADTLTALDHDAQALNAQNESVGAAQASLALIQRQYDAGAVNYVSLLTAQQSYQQARIAYVRAIASRYADTISLFQALGGGWWHRSDPGALRTSSLTPENSTALR
jgi:NodT family efflux transporter outer membrane factor (OMF) lipoprotein